jgi:hypothetical protein
MTAESDDPSALTETPPQQSRGSAKEGNTAVSAVKDTGAATPLISKPRLRLVPIPPRAVTSSTT